LEFVVVFSYNAFHLTLRCSLTLSLAFFVSKSLPWSFFFFPRRGGMEGRDGGEWRLSSVSFFEGLALVAFESRCVGLSGLLSQDIELAFALALACLSAGWLADWQTLMVVQHEGPRRKCRLKRGRKEGD
jgi:hypothetical protein